MLKCHMRHVARARQTRPRRETLENVPLRKQPPSTCDTHRAVTNPARWRRSHLVSLGSRSKMLIQRSYAFLLLVNAPKWFVVARNDKEEGSRFSCSCSKLLEAREVVRIMDNPVIASTSRSIESYYSSIHGTFLLL